MQTTLHKLILKMRAKYGDLEVEGRPIKSLNLCIDHNP